MKTSSSLTRAIAGLGIVAVLAADAAGQGPPAAAAASGTDAITQFQVPYPNGRPRDPFVAPDGRIWFVGQAANYLGVFDPKTQQFARHELPTQTAPHTNIITPDGIVWLAGNGNGTIVRFDPKTAATKIIPVPLEGRPRSDPHTMIYDGKGGIWFTSQQSGFVGHLDIATDKVRVVRTTAMGDTARRSRTNPYGIILDPNGHPWFDLFATNKIGTIDPRTMELKTFTVTEGARPRRIARSSDGGIWYTDYSRCMVGRLDVGSGKVDEYASPSGGNCGPYAMVADDADRVWWTETGTIPNRMVAMDTKTRKIVYNYAIPGDGRNSVRHMVFDPKTRQIWYGADLNFLGSVKVPLKPAM